MHMLSPACLIRLQHRYPRLPSSVASLKHQKLFQTTPCSHDRHTSRSSEWTSYNLFNMVGHVESNCVGDSASSLPETAVLSMNMLRQETRRVRMAHS